MTPSSPSTGRAVFLLQSLTDIIGVVQETSLLIFLFLRLSSIMSVTSSPGGSTPLRISAPPSYSSLPPIITPPSLIHDPQGYRGTSPINQDITKSQWLLGILLDKPKYDKTASSLPRLPHPLREGGADIFSSPSLTRPVSRLPGKYSPDGHTSPDEPCGGARVLASPLHVTSPPSPKQKYKDSCLAIPVPSPTISQDIPSSHALLFYSHTSSTISMSPIDSTLPHLLSSFATVPVPPSPGRDAPPSIPDPSVSGMMLHAPVPDWRVSRGVPRLSPLERSAREMLGESAPETQAPSPQEHSALLYERTGSNLVSPSPPQSRFSARLRRLAPPALQLVPTPTEFSSPGPSTSIGGLRILQASSTQQGTPTIGLGIYVPRITQPEIVQQTPVPVSPSQATRSQVPEFGQVGEDPQSPEFGPYSPDSPPLEYMDIGSPRTPPNLPRHTLLSLPTVTPALSQGVSYDSFPSINPVPGRQQVGEEDVPMLPAYTDVVEADRISAQFRPEYPDQPVAGPSHLPALDLLFVARSDTGDLLGRVDRCVGAIRPIGLVSGEYYLSISRVFELIGALLSFAVSRCLLLHSKGTPLPLVRCPSDCAD